MVCRFRFKASGYTFDIFKLSQTCLYLTTTAITKNIFLFHVAQLSVFANEARIDFENFKNTLIKRNCVIIFLLLYQMSQGRGNIKTSVRGQRVDYQIR